MATNPRFDSEGSGSVSPADQSPTQGSRVLPREEPGDSDLAELTATFNAFGGAVTPEISSNLALEIVLNEVAEQACLATGASGAAIALERDGEWICRASAGSNAPQLGARLDAERGLSGACVHTRQVQRSGDALNDARVDAEACRELGVYSVIVFPLLLKGKLAGVFELFSMERSAFRERDERTLEALSQRVLKILEPRFDPPATSEAIAAATPPKVETPIETAYLAGSDSGNFSSLPLQQTPQDEGAQRRSFQIFTWILGVAVLASFAFLIVIFVQRLVGRKAAFHPPQPIPSISASTAASSTTQSGRAEETAGKSQAGKAPTSTIGALGTKPPDSATQSKESSAPAGSLLVFENGQEIFRMPPVADQSGAVEASTSLSAAAKAERGETSAQVVKQAGIQELSPEVAAGNLLYRVEPDYPKEALEKRIQGAVVVQVRAGVDGAVRVVNRISGDPLLADAAIAAVKQWRFKPSLIQGHPTETQTKVILNFKLPQ